MGKSTSEPGHLSTDRPIEGTSIAVICSLSLIAWLAVLFLLWPYHGTLLSWDAVDYVNVAEQGVFVNALDQGSLSPLEFVRFSMAKISGRTPKLPDEYSESRDPFLQRHYHPPLIIYLISPFSKSKNERVIRSVQLVGAFAFIFVVLLSYRSISFSTGWYGSILVTLLAIWMSQIFFKYLTFHGWSAVWTTSSAALMGQWLFAGRSIRRGFLLCLSLALVFLTLEIGLVVWVGSMLCMLIWGGRTPGKAGWQLPWRPLLIGLALTLLLVVLAWPGSILKASLLKIPSYYLYRIWLGDEYASVSSLLPNIINSSLPILILGPLAFSWLFFFHRADMSRWGPFLVIGGLYGIVMVFFSLRIEYILPAFTPFICVVGVAVDRLPSKRARAIVFVIALFTILIPWQRGAVGDPGKDTTMAREDIHWLGDVLLGRDTLADGAQIYRYYLGADYNIQSIIVEYKRVAYRDKGSYRTLNKEDLHRKMIIIRKDGKSIGQMSAVERLLDHCKRTDRHTMIAYDCSTGPSDAENMGEQIND